MRTYQKISYLCSKLSLDKKNKYSKLYKKWLMIKLHLIHTFLKEKQNDQIHVIVFIVGQKELL